MWKFLEDVIKKMTVKKVLIVIGFLLGGWILWIVIKPLLDAVQQAQAVKTISESKDLKAIATGVANALGVAKTNSWYNGWGEDEDTVINLLKNVTPSEYNKIAAFYKLEATNSRDLTNDLQAYLSQEQLKSLNKIIYE